MSLDLTLVFDPFKSNPDCFHGYNRLRMDSAYRLFEAIQDSDPAPLNPGRVVDWYGDEGLETRDTDVYGDRLTLITASALVAVMNKFDLSPKNAAVFAYLRALPPDEEVILWWP